jgi:hypothetical protein
MSRSTAYRLRDAIRDVLGAHATVRVRRLPGELGNYVLVDSRLGLWEIHSREGWDAWRDRFVHVLFEFIAQTRVPIVQTQTLRELVQLGLNSSPG